jgi:hypothetical protein
MTTTEPKAEAVDRHGYHAVWCTNQDAEFNMHSDEEPYCLHHVAGFSVIAEGVVVKRQGWVGATTPFDHGTFTKGELEDRARIYTGVEISLESWSGPGTDWTDERIRLTSDVARSLAAALIRAADIQQGLTR